MPLQYTKTNLYIPWSNLNEQVLLRKLYSELFVEVLTNVMYYNAVCYDPDEKLCDQTRFKKRYRFYASL